MTGPIVVGAALAQRPQRAGHAWMVLNWLAAFRRLGHDVVFADRIDPTLGAVRAGVYWVATTLGSLGVPWSVLLGDGSATGMPRRELLARARGGVLVNVMGYLDDPQLMDVAARRVFLDIDPGFGQAWQHAGLASVFVGHDAYATVGLNVGRAEGRVPDLGIEWITTLPPVDLDLWPASPPPSEGRFTTVATWRGPFAPVEIDGVVHGLRVHEARRYRTLPSTSGRSLEIALDIDPGDGRDRDALLDGGWVLRDPRSVAGDVDAYRQYIQSSRGEFSIAKQIYVSLRSGWFSDRSACYLASGRPVVASDTGLAPHLPTGEGLLTFDGPESAEQALAEVHEDADRHTKAARQIAEAHFDGRLVAARLLERAT